MSSPAVLSPPSARLASPVIDSTGALSDIVRDWQPDTDHVWAWEHYRPSLLDLSRRLGLRRLCEIGGGRDPLFTPDELAPLAAELVVNDIAQSELDRGPGGYETACFDISGDVSPLVASGLRFDLMFSRMVFEHVADGEAAWRNVHALLNPGGVGLAFVPTLYAWPFLVNHMLPEGLSTRMLRLVYPERNAEGGEPKFPTRYSLTFGSQDRVAPILHDIGFSEVTVLPFWGHHYVRRIPGLNALDNAFTALCKRADWRLMTSYAYIIARR